LAAISNSSLVDFYFVSSGEAVRVMRFIHLLFGFSAAASVLSSSTGVFVALVEGVTNARGAVGRISEKTVNKNFDGIS